jgi:hypothetical protein
MMVLYVSSQFKIIINDNYILLLINVINLVNYILITVYKFK